MNKVVRECLEAGKTYNKSITAKTTQLLTGLDSVLLELKSLSDARDSSRTKTTRPGQDASCDCAIALGILPLVNRDAVASASDPKPTPAAAPASAKAADPIAEDLTDRVLLKIEASMERLRELAEMIQATSMQGEANLVSKVTLPDGTLTSLSAAIHASAASATAAAIAQERGHLSSAFGRLFTPLQVQKLQTWYYLYPRPLTDELTLMRTILNYRPYANPFQATALTLAHIRDWFKRRRHRERMRFLKLALEAGRDPHAAEEEINLRLEQRVEHLRATVDLNDLVKEVDKVRAESPLYDSMVTAFARPSHVNAYIAASHALPAPGERYGLSSSRAKRPRSQDADVDDALVVKPATGVEVAALQRRLRSQLALARSATTTNALQQVVDVLRAMDVSPDVRIQTGLVADLKQILKTYRKPTLLRKSTIALLERIGMSRRPVVDTGDDARGDDASQHAPANGHDNGADASMPPPPPPPSNLPLASPTHHEDDEVELMSGAAPPPPPPVSRRGKREKGRRPMKFSMQQVTALEGWFQQTYKPSQIEMETYLDALNAPPLRDAKKQLTDVSMTQLRRWFNKRRCLRRPPFALMTSSTAATATAAAATATAPSKDDDEDDEDDSHSVADAPDAAVGADTDELEDDDDDANDSDDNDSTGGNSSSDRSNGNDSSDDDENDDD